MSIYSVQIIVVPDLKADVFQYWTVPEKYHPFMKSVFLICATKISSKREFDFKTFQEKRKPAMSSLRMKAWIQTRHLKKDFMICFPVTKTPLFRINPRLKREQLFPPVDIISTPFLT